METPRTELRGAQTEVVQRLGSTVRDVENESDALIHIGVAVDVAVNPGTGRSYR